MKAVEAPGWFKLMTCRQWPAFYPIVLGYYVLRLWKKMCIKNLKTL